MNFRLLPVLVVLSPLGVGGQTTGPTTVPASATDPAKVALVFSGGHETDPRDHGRPVKLIAAALGVPEEVFRDAFGHVHPAPAGEQPDPAQVWRNKQELLSRLAPYGVTNERLDEVSNYYRYRPGSGELWRHVDAAGFALVRGGKILAITITEPGVGYSSPPRVALATGLSEYPVAVISYGIDLARNGSVMAVTHPPLGDDAPNGAF
jgi:hypothetical protein